MWKIENGKRVEVVEDIFYMGSLLSSFYELIVLDCINKNKIYEIYREIMNLVDRNDRIKAISTIEEKAKFELEKRDKRVDLEKIVASVMKTYKKTSKFNNTELEDKATIENLYNVAKVIRPSQVWCLYIFYMQMLAFDKEKRAKEVEHAYKQLCIEKIEEMGLLTEKEANQKIIELGKSKFLEKVRKILESEGEKL